MSICRFCEQEFANSQAVRAHLKGCTAYQNRLSRQISQPPNLGSTSLGNASRVGNDTQDTAFDPVQLMRQRVEVEELMLKLRTVEKVHKEIDDKDRAQEQARRQEIQQSEDTARAAQREREHARLREEYTLKAKHEKEQAEQRRRETRRAIIQDVKREVIEGWIHSWSISSALKVQILREIENALSPLPVDELPKEELLLIAQSKRDSTYKLAVEAEQKAQLQQQQRQSLIQHGADYAWRELRNVKGLDGLERWEIVERVKEELKDVTGNETKTEIEDWVEDILEEQGFEFDDDE